MDQRYYSNQFGRFMTPDPDRSSAGLTNPGSWNRYAYASGDPIRYGDRRGLDGEDCDEGGCLDIGPGDVWGLPPWVPFPSPGPTPLVSPEGTGPWNSVDLRTTNILFLQALEASAIAWAKTFYAPQRYVANLQLEPGSDCVNLHDPETGGIARHRTYQAFDQFGAPIDATITERVFNPDGTLATGYIQNPISSFNTGEFKDGVGPGPFQGSASLYQHFVTSLPGGYWTNVPTYVNTPTGNFMVFNIQISFKTFNGNRVADISYNGDSIWNADGTLRLPECPK